ncbi:MAG: hypothetical protein KAU46_10365 [Candidatus Aminicenantes bacterium]|nr:hypothetical protein [Candidatus Aminicenantes bacterium]
MTNLEKFNALKESRAKELSMKHARIMEEIEQLPPGTEISPKKKKELATFEKELQEILEGKLIGDVLPIRPTIRDLISKSKPIEKKADGPLITFHFEAFSAINTRIKKFKIDATSKNEAWEMAREKTKNHPGQINLKIS